MGRTAGAGSAGAARSTAPRPRLRLPITSYATAGRPTSILRELATCYRAARARQPVPLPDAASFSRYAHDEASSREEQATDLAYWTSLYRDIPPLPELPADRPRPAATRLRRRHIHDAGRRAASAGLRRTAAASGATLFSTLFTALQIVIGRLSNTSDVVIGVPVALQAVEDRPDLVGHCVNMLPFRSPIDWNKSFSSMVRMAAGRLAEGFDHARCTYGTLVRALPIERTVDRLPLTEIQFNLERLSTATDFGDLSVKVTPNAKAAAIFDLCVNVIESRRRGCGSTATTARPCSTRRRSRAGWSTTGWCLESIVAAPETPLAALELLSTEQKRFVLDIANDTATPYPRRAASTTCSPSRQPGRRTRVACSDDTGSLTYAELDRPSTALAHALCRRVPRGAAGLLSPSIDPVRCSSACWP